MSHQYNLGEIMKFLGEIKKVPCVDYFVYHRDMVSVKHKVVLTSDYKIDGCYDVYAVITGKFDESFCSGANPLSLTENGESFVEADIQISFDLLERLKIDNETSLENLKGIELELGINES